MICCAIANIKAQAVFVICFDVTEQFTYFNIRSRPTGLKGLDINEVFFIIYKNKITITACIITGGKAR
jgi:hypothetical protein